MNESLTLELRQNFEAFKKLEPNLIDKATGKYALMRRRKLINIYDTARDAEVTGAKFYEDKLFSIQKIGQKPINLGYYSHAVRLAPAR